MTEAIDVVVVGAGQAGLAVSYELTRADVPHVVLERGRVGQTWRGLWDSFRLIGPNWTVQLPGHPYDGEDRDGFLARDEVVAYLERYASAVDAPVRDGVDVTSLRRGRAGGFVLETSTGRMTAGTVVVSTGAYPRPHRPPCASTLPADVAVLDVVDYRNPAGVPAGDVLVVGSGESGCQIAEELRLAGRNVCLACGRAPWVQRRIGDKDAMWWAVQGGFFEAPFASLPHPKARLGANIQITGGLGGEHDLHYRTLQAIGVTLLGRFLGAEGHEARFAADLAESVAWGDAVHAQLRGLVARVAAERGLAQPEMPDPEPFVADAPETLDLAGFGAVIFATGYRPDYASWVDIEDVVDELGFPLQHDGASTTVPGLYFVGVHFLRKRKSSLLLGVGEDAAIVARQVAAEVAAV